MRKKNLINFIITGGTIDSYYDGSRDTIVPNEKSIIPKFIGSLNLYDPVKFTQVCMKDSRDLSPQDLEAILSEIKMNWSTKKFIITHGTYTMADTGRYLQHNLKDTDKTVVITGSFIPIQGFSPSDGPFNLGYAVSQAQVLPPGIYVAMNGRIFQPDEVAKYIKEGRFISLFGEKK